MDKDDRIKLLFAMFFTVPVGYFMAVDTIKRYNTSGMVLTSGKIVGELPRQGMRPTVEIQVDNQPISVKANLLMNSAESMPRNVTFYFDGNSETEVHCQEETNPIWFLVVCVTLPIGLLIWDFRARRRENASQ